ncbi:MAG: hypothetical protein CMF57_13115 [Leifsonia sp.]|jgi:hypothetical protein|nr:hypothetical protein [Leifsonia sp.]
MAFVRLVRPIRLAGKRREIGECLEVSPAFAANLVSANQAERIPEEDARQVEHAESVAAEAAARETPEVAARPRARRRRSTPAPE